MELGCVVIYVPNVKEAMDFYVKAFGLEVEFMVDEGIYGHLKAGSGTIAFLEENFALEDRKEFTKNRKGSPAPAFEVDLVSEDIHAAYKRAVDAGATPVYPPTPKPWGQSVAYVKDLNGVFVEICTPMGPCPLHEEENNKV